MRIRKNKSDEGAGEGGNEIKHKAEDEREKREQV